VDLGAITLGIDLHEEVALPDDVPLLDRKLDDLTDDDRRLDVDLRPGLDPACRGDERGDVLHGRLGHVDLLALLLPVAEHGGGDHPADHDDGSCHHKALLKIGHPANAEYSRPKQTLITMYASQTPPTTLRAAGWDRRVVFESAIDPTTNAQM